jgi:hypothetical protein
VADQHVSTITIIIQLAWWCGLAAKYLLVMRCEQKTVREATAWEQPHGPCGFAADASKKLAYTKDATSSTGA